MNEIWKDVPDYEGIYQVSNLGNVKSLKKGKEKILSKRITSSGYVLYSLFKKGVLKQIQAHQLVAITFLGHKPNGNTIVVDHVDNDKLNNRLDNLQLITNRENILKDKKSTRKYTGVVWHKKANKWMVRIKIYGKSKYLGLFKNEYDAHLVYQNAFKQIL